MDIPSEFGGVSATFNVGDLSPYMEDENLADLRTNPSQPGESDENQAMVPTKESNQGSNQLHQVQFGSVLYSLTLGCNIIQLEPP